MEDRLALAGHYLEIGNPKRALAELEKGAGPGGVEEAEFWAIRAGALFELERWGQAAEAATRGLAVDPDEITLLDVLALCELELGRNSEADKAILAALEIAPDHPDLLAHRALILARSKRYKDAEAIIDEALRVAPRSPSVLRVRALVASMRGDRRRAAEYADEVLALEPDSELSHYVRGGTDLNSAQFKRAVRHLEEAARLNPESPEIAEALRDARVGAHPLLAPVRPIWRFGRWRSWIAYLAVGSILAAARLESLRLVLALVWIAVCILSWVGPPLLRRWYDRKRRVF